MLRKATKSYTFRLLLKTMRFFIYFIFVLTIVSCQTNSNHKISKKIVIAHRGASGYLPEHTLESKAMAYAMHPDFIEQDLVLSKDDVPIVIHDIYLDDVTNVASRFPNKKRADGRYYVIDFTFAELKSLHVTERFDPETNKQVYSKRFPKNKSSFQLHSLQEEIELIQGLNKSTGNTIGIYPEIKNPKFHNENGKDISKIVLNILSKYGYENKKDKCILQCFDAQELRKIREEYQSELFLVQLIESPEETLQIADFASYADGIGPWYKLMLSEKVDGKFTFTSLVEESHKLGLVIHPYTFRADNLAEFDSFKQMVNVILYQGNADGGFTDFPDKMKQYIK